MSIGSLSLELPAAPDGEPPSRLPILPGGDVVRGKDGRAWRNSQALLARLRGRVVTLDENHASFYTLPGAANAGQPAPAMARLRNFSLGEDGSVWANHVEWTRYGQDTYAGGKYLSLSPVILFDPAGASSDVLGTVADIHSVALVNDANLTMPAINCRNLFMSQNSQNSQAPAAPPAAPPAPAVAPEPPAAPVDPAATPEPTAETLGAVFAKALGDALKPLADQISALAAKVNTPAPAAAPNSATPEHVAACNSALAEFVKAGKIPPSSDAKAMFMAQTATPAGLESARAYYTNAPAIVAVNAAELTTPPAVSAKRGWDALTENQRHMIRKNGWDPADLYPEHFDKEAK